MKIALLNNGKQKQNRWSQNLIDSLISLGYQVEPLRANLVKEQELYKYDLIIGYGLSKEVPDSKPYLVFDLGYVDRYSRDENPDGYLQASLSRPANIVQEKVKSDRNNIKVEEVYVPEGAPILILGQKEGDKQHGMTSPQLKAYYQAIIDSLEGEEVLFKPHPKSQIEVNLKGSEVIGGTCEELVGNVSKVYTYNSTGALPFLKYLTPVISSEVAYYHEVGKNPCKKEVELLFDRISYSQWNADELGDPEVVKNLVEYAIEGKAPKSWTSEEITKKPQPKSQEPVKKESSKIELPKEEVTKTPDEPKQIVITQEHLQNVDPIPEVTEFHISTAYAILAEKDFHTKQKMFKQIWPDVKHRSKKDIESHCKSIVNQSKE